MVTATKTPLPKVTEVQPADAGSVLEVQVIPSVEVIAVDDGNATLPATTTKMPLPKAILFQKPEFVIAVLAVQVIPSGEVMAALVPPETVTKIPFPKAIGPNCEFVGMVRAVQVIPSVDVAAERLPKVMAAKVPLP